MTVDEPTRWLQDANTSVKRNSFYMKKALVRHLTNSCGQEKCRCFGDTYAVPAQMRCGMDVFTPGWATADQCCRMAG